MTGLPMAFSAGAGWCKDIPTGRRTKEHASAAEETTVRSFPDCLWMTLATKVEEQL